MSELLIIKQVTFCEGFSYYLANHQIKLIFIVYMKKLCKMITRITNTLLAGSVYLYLGLSVWFYLYHTKYVL